ncbi:stonin-1-like [Rhinophrynus dorsalis]
MCSTTPESWVKFDDENPFQPPQKSLFVSQDKLYTPKSNGLKLSLCNEQLLCTTAANTTTPPVSPVFDFFMSPGPPSNSPLCTPVRDCPGTPCTPNLSSYNLYPISEVSRIQPYTLSETPTITIATYLPSNILLSTDSSFPVCSSPGKASPSYSRSNSYLGNHLESAGFEYPQSDCAFSSPFWNNDVTTVISPTKTNITPKTFTKEKLTVKQDYNKLEKETCDKQKSLNQCSFSYVCERLQHLKTEAPAHPKHVSVCSERDGPSFIPQSLFRSQRKDGWPFMLRIPEKKNMMSSRQWGPIYLKVQSGGILQMYYEKGLEKPFKEFQLHQFCRLSETKLENLNVSEKIHTVKIEHVTYSGKRKYHPKIEVAHDLEIEQMLKLGTTNYCDFTDFITTLEEELMMLSPVSKQKKVYEEPEMIVELVDNFWGEVTKEGKLKESTVHCQMFCLCFIDTGVECFLTLNDAELQKVSKDYFDKESKKSLINIFDYHFHKCVKIHEFQTSRIIKFIPADACRFELMRFRTSFNGDEPPFSLKTTAVVQGAYVELQAFLNMSPIIGASPQLNSTKHCENITIHFPVPSQWMKALWTVSLQRQRFLKTKMNRRACLGSEYEIESEPVIQVTVGTAKYEHAYKAVVWKIDRLPDKNSSYDQPHSLSCKLELGSDQEIPHNWNPFARVQFVMPSTSISGAEVKSMGIVNDIQPHKHIIQKTCYNFQVEIERKRIQTEGDDPDRHGDCITQ